VRLVILSREDGEGSQLAKLEILRFAQDDVRLVILSREDGEGSQLAKPLANTHFRDAIHE
jgi:hypothetical protein